MELDGASDLEISADGQYVYVTAPGYCAVYTFRRDADSGQLSLTHVLHSVLFDRISDLVPDRADGSRYYAASGTDDLTITLIPDGDTLRIADPGQGAFAALIAFGSKR